MDICKNTQKCCQLRSELLHSHAPLMASGLPQHQRLVAACAAVCTCSALHAPWLCMHSSCHVGAQHCTMMRRHLAAWAGLLALWPANAAEQHVRWHPPLTVGSTVLAHNRSSINCAAPVDMQHLTELASSAANYTELTAAASRYILHLVAPVVHNCTYISLMQPSLWLPMSPPGAPMMMDA